MLQTINININYSALLSSFIPKEEDHANDILCGWGIAIIYGDLPFTVHVCTGLSTLAGETKKKNAESDFNETFMRKVDKHNG